ncbi:MAG: methyltransferase domain-containing protein [Phormidesmis sp. CAN_BIN36]|nr:methyltransferase domain-containing protein [Phormidesmis sp. CAN_BIN36]
MTKQTWNPESYAKNARFVSDLGEPLLNLLQLVPGERILDLGCGDGALTEKLVAAGGLVLGVDASAEQVQATRQRGLEAEVCTAEDLPFVEEFDAVFSNAVLHWVKDQPIAIAKVYRSLKPNSRFVAELGGFGNVATIRNALHAALRDRGINPQEFDPWFFPTVDEYQTLLEDQGFEVDSIVLFARPTLLPSDISGWLETFAQPFLRAVPLDDRDDCIEEVRDRVYPILFQEGEGWVADYTRLRFRAIRRAA